MYAVALTATLPVPNPESRHEELLFSMSRVGLRDLRVRPLADGKMLVTCSLNAEDEAAAMSHVVGEALEVFPSLKVLEISAVGS